MFSQKTLAISLALGLLLIGAASYKLLAADKKAEKDEVKAKGYLGIYMGHMTPDDRDEFGVKFGVLVTKVEKDSPADKAGIKRYDVIQYFNDERVRRTDDLAEAIESCKPGTNAAVKLVRDGKEKEITVTLGKAKPDRYLFNFGDKNDRRRNMFLFRKGGFLGVNLQPLNKDLAGYFGVKEDEGALIMGVSKDSPAEKAGLKSGDVIQKIDKNEISKPDDVIKIISDLKPGDKVSIDVIRHNKKVTVTAELEENHGLENIHIFRGIGGRNHLAVPDFNFCLPGIEMDGHELLWNDNDKDEKLDRVHEKLEDMDVKIGKKLKKVKEYIYI
jgi:predicted metalloprotease with PDZ domain